MAGWCWDVTNFGFEASDNGGKVSHLELSVGAGFLQGKQVSRYAEARDVRRGMSALVAAFGMLAAGSGKDRRFWVFWLAGASDLNSSEKS